jgi:hypothetical protein
LCGYGGKGEKKKEKKKKSSTLLVDLVFGETLIEALI